MSVKRRILGPPIPKMPMGLVEIMDGLAREVLKNNPENIYEFCARHMQTLVEIRDGRALHPVMTLEQKIEKAQKKVKQRAEERRRAYDKKIKEEVNKQQVITADAPHGGDDLEGSEKKEIENKVDVQPEEKQEIKEVIEKQELEKASELKSELINDTNNQTNVLNKVEVQQVEDKKHDNGHKCEIVAEVESKNEKSDLLIIENEPETDDTTKDKNVDNKVSTEIKSIENKENLPETTSENNIVDNHNVAELLPDETNIQLASHDSTEDNMLSPKIGEITLHYEEAEIMQNNSGTELQNEFDANMKDTSDEINSSDIIEKAVLSSGNDFQENSNFGIDANQNETLKDAPSTNNSLNNIDSETPSNTEANNNLPKKQSENLNEPEKSSDDQILTVILSSNNIENVSTNEADVTKSNGPDTVEIIVTELIPSEVESRSEQSTDIESVPDSSHDSDKTNNMNSSMDLETAAITIQKVFRSFLFKTKTASYDDPTTVDMALLTEDKEKEDNEVPNIKDRRHLGISRMDTVLQTVNEEKSLSLSTDDSSTLSSAATIIQAHVRGYLVRNKMNLNKTISSNSLIDSDAPSIPSLEADSDNIKSKTVLNIHIVPEGGHFVSRDESLLTSMDLSLDSSPPSSVNLHPLGYDKSERRKQLKREDAIQSVSPPSNNSGKLSEDHDSVKEVLIESNTETEQVTLGDKTVVEGDVLEKENSKVVTENDSKENLSTDTASDEMDVVTPFAESRTPRESDNSTKLLHSGEFHDIVVPTNVTRSDTSVVRGE